MGDDKKAVEKLLQGAVQAAAETENKAIFSHLDAISCIYEGISKARRTLEEGQAREAAQGVRTKKIKIQDLIVRIITDMCGEGPYAEGKAEEFFGRVRDQIREDRRCRGRREDEPDPI